MEIVYVLLPLSLMLALGGFIAYLWSVRSGQFEDLESPAVRILFDDELAAKKPTDKESEQVREPPDSKKNM